MVLRQTPLDSALTLANQIRTSVEGKKLVKKSTGDILGTITISGGVALLTPLCRQERRPQPHRQQDGGVKLRHARREKGSR